MYWFGNFMVAVLNNDIRLGTSVEVRLMYHVQYIKYIKYTATTAKYFHIMDGKLTRYEKFDPAYTLTRYDDGHIVYDAAGYKLRIVDFGNRRMVELCKTYYFDKD